MEALFASGRIVDLILLGVLAEAALLFALTRSLARFAPLAATLASGAALMLALRAALTGSSWPIVAGWMLMGLAAHGADLFLRRPARAADVHADAWPQAAAGPDRNNAERDAFRRRRIFERF